MSDIVEDIHLSKAEELCSLLLPRVMFQFTEQAQNEIDAIRQLKDKGGDNKELNAQQRKLKKILSVDVQKKVFDKVSALLKASLDYEALERLIVIEKDNIAVQSVGEQLDRIFEEAVKES